ncbi:MAG: hypothetical protein QNJ55_26925 [Xenococcus sp. MO_188.B8]|nr:hypothetical protein [Xenococcus sp. MO_188.B8]
MSHELLTAQALLNIALGGIVGNAASDGVRKLGKQLWQRIRNRLLQNQPTIEAEIVNFEQSPIAENTKLLEDFLQVEMHKDKEFAEAISNLGREISHANGGSITNKNIKAEGNAVAAAMIDAPNSRIGGSDNHYHLGKEQAQMKF